ncbi:GNAT family N-acetyltransferase [Mucilaginibacter pocheonensis]|uniref:Ribosomal protein S18 acetylase RimI-like enzyme n=1 Tax=Mucilaginibacter pocheonensis TaxID=398050 RepID=A0ABU1TD59_9SPHI|nr:GNAT family N-acetyltransferase [Mucilaginibacter pocheonensis]MDR6943219.1 ribosomal protein S18 acetylase RimI-like enzyme [Mucilaginibacter pocheonensis]
MRAKIYELMYPLLNDGSGIYELDDLKAYVDKIMEKACIISVMEQNVLLGFLAYYANDYESKNAFLSMVVISPTVRKMGYGRRLVDFFIADLVLKGFKRCLTEVKEDNIKAINVCKKVGFSLIGKKDKYLIMEKML